MLKKNTTQQSLRASLLMVVLVAALPTFAQEKAVATPAPTSGQIAPTVTRRTPPVAPNSDTYRIGREDVLDISVLKFGEYNRQVTVLTDGTISYPRLGQFVVTGMTLKQLEQKIFMELDKIYVNPQVTVSLRSRHLRTVSVLGNGVKSNGKREMRDGWRVLDAIADAGGVTTSRTEFLTVKLIQMSKDQEVELDLTKVLANDPAQNLLLEVGDVLSINERPVMETQIQVSGAVGRSGAMLIPQDGSILRALYDAGGPTQIAALSKALIERNGTTIPVDLRGPVRDGVEPAGLRLQAGDRLVIPEVKEFYYVNGAVAAPGMKLVPDDRKVTVASALQESNLQILNSEHKRVILIRDQPDGTTATYKIDVEKMLNNGDYSQDMAIQAGDKIVVPYKKKVFHIGFSEIFSTFQAVSSGLYIYDRVR